MSTENQTAFPCQWCLDAKIYFSSQANLAMHISMVHVGNVVPLIPEPVLKIYVAGPMTGLPDYNYPEFHAAADLLRKAGYEVFNPAEIEDSANPPKMWHEYMRLGLTKMLLCQGVALLDGYENSKGALIEINLAYSLGMELRTLDGWLTA